VRKRNKYFLKTFGCIQNFSDSERVRAFYNQNGEVEADSWEQADEVIINSCVIRESAENRVYGLIDEIQRYCRRRKKKILITLTGCLTGTKKGRITGVDKYLPIKNISYQIPPLRDRNKAALIVISTGCNNRCSYCIVPIARGAEESRKMAEIIDEAEVALKNGFKEVVLIGQNVNSYGADFHQSSTVSMGKLRLKSDFPKLLKNIADMDFEKVTFISSNPWDFSEELIKVISEKKNIDRLIHLPIQSGDDQILKNMNRGYTAAEYISLVKKIRKNIDGVEFSTDIIIGFPGEDEKAFENTVKLCREVGFKIAYLNKYSPRKGTVAAKLFKDDVPVAEKKRRWKILNDLINHSPI
jgi:tRNA-2-methylthio-N6-dimethylallyladenosine synthase